MLRSAAIVLVLVASCLPASAGDRQDPGAFGFEVMLGTIIQNALTPPPPRPLYLPPPVYEAPPPRPLSREEWRQAIAGEARRYCATYPADAICHFQDEK
jgi:hypothetical protein